MRRRLLTLLSNLLVLVLMVGAALVIMERNAAAQRAYQLCRTFHLRIDT